MASIGAVLEKTISICKIQAKLDADSSEEKIDLKTLKKEIEDISEEREEIDSVVRAVWDSERKIRNKRIKKIYNSHIHRQRQKNNCQRDCCKGVKYFHQELKGGFNEPKVNLKKLGHSGYPWVWVEEFNPPNTFYRYAKLN